MTQHTPEPWSYGEDNDGWYVSVGDTQIAYGLSEENACHIVACVDACAGIVNPDIKIPKLQEALIEAVEQLQKAEQQRDELQKRCDNQHDAIYEIIDAAGELVSIVKIHSQATNNNFAWAELQNLEEAIAKAGA